MARFCELGVEADVIIGKGIDMEEIVQSPYLD